MLDSSVVCAPIKNAGHSMLRPATETWQSERLLDQLHLLAGNDTTVEDELVFVRPRRKE
jgi:hypothetical protein